MFNVKSECLLDVCVNLVDRDFAAWLAKAFIPWWGEEGNRGSPSSSSGIRDS